MADIDRIIEQVLAASRAKGGRVLSSERTYADEPILVRGSRLASYLPDKVREMRALERSPEARGWTDARLFVEQARLMEDYEDDCPYPGSFLSYFPTYAAMSDRQLRGYFTWRTRVRAGEVVATSASFAYVYLYELLNGVGARAGEEAFRAIEAFWRRYREFEPAMDRYVRPWLVDYVVYHDLDPALARPHLNVEHDRAVAELASAEARAVERRPVRGRRAPRAYGTDPAGTASLLDALDELSTYRPKSARLFRDEPDTLREVCRAVFEELARYYRRNRAQGLTQSLFGTRHPMPHLMFASAVFYPTDRPQDRTCVLDETCSYACSGGIWTCDALHDGGGRSARLGEILRATDRHLRAALAYPHPLKEQGEAKYLAGIIDREVADYLAWRQRNAPVRVEIDLSKLAGIRSAAATTREALLVDEERDDPPVVDSVGDEEGSAEPSPPVAPESSAPVLAPDELALVRALLDGVPPTSGSVDLLVDSINERLFDLLGDTAIEFGATGEPALVEDYADDVRDALGLT